MLVGEQPEYPLRLVFLDMVFMGIASTIALYMLLKNSAGPLSEEDLLEKMKQFRLIIIETTMNSDDLAYFANRIVFTSRISDFLPR